MTLDEAIEHCEEKACDNTECSQEHKQLAEWLKELKRLRQENHSLNHEIGSYAGSVEAITEELDMLTGRMEFLKNKMLNKK